MSVVLDYVNTVIEEHKGWNLKCMEKRLPSVIQTLSEYKSQGKEIYPKATDVFNAFKYCSYEDLSVVLVGQDPYPQPGIADGLAFSCSKSNKPQPSLRYIFDEIERTTGSTNKDCDLKRWAEQGVLLLNIALTVEKGIPNSHTLLWSPFISSVLIELDTKKNCVFVFLGGEAKPYGALIRNNTTLYCSHPASAAYRGGAWDCNDIFNKINENLFNKEIKW